MRMTLLKQKLTLYHPRRDLVRGDTFDISDPLGRALSAMKFAAEAEPTELDLPAEPPKKRTYKRRDLQAEE